MKTKSVRVALEGILAVSLSLLAIFVFLRAWLMSTEPVILGDILVGLLLVLSAVLTSKYPIHIRYHTKISMMTVPLYLLAVLLPPHLAVLFAGLGLVIIELLMRRQLGSTLTDMLTSSSRWILIIFLGTQIAHIPRAHDLAEILLLFGVAATMFVGDMVSVSFQIAPMCGESPWHVLKTTLHESAIPEGAMYLIGILGGLAAFREIWSLPLLILPMAITYQAFKNVKEMRSSTQQMLEAMADAVDLRDPYTGGHSRRVSDWCARILHEMGIMGTETDLIIRTARVHDIGKIGIPDNILLKPGVLSSEERKVMESHAEIGSALVERYADFAHGTEIIRHHHERWDGGGYPNQLAKYDIPFGARVVAVADSLDAITSDRPYRGRKSIEQARDILRNGSGTQWDPVIVESCLKCLAADQPTESETYPLGSFKQLLTNSQPEVGI
jgi:hypothetical protein